MADGIFIIAEAGVNHNGEPEMALALVDAAAKARADAVKFQTFKAESLATGSAPKAQYQETAAGGGESQLGMLRRLELGEDLHLELMARCIERKIQFLSSPFDAGSLDFLVNGLGLKTIKIPSGEITNGPLLLQAALSGRDIIMSTGMSTLKEVEEALSVIAFGYARSGQPSRGAFKAAFDSIEGQGALKEKVTLLHCTTEYPAPFEDANLKAMDALSETFGLAVGLSDHTQGISVAIAAAARGAAMIEKHLTLDKTLPGPDHQASLEPGEMKEMVGAIRNVEAALGDGAKEPKPSEMKNIPITRKSLTALRAIKAGEPFSEENLGAKRPGGGISPMEYWDWMGKPASRDYAINEPLET